MAVRTEFNQRVFSQSEIADMASAVYDEIREAGLATFKDEDERRILFTHLRGKYPEFMHSFHFVVYLMLEGHFKSAVFHEFLPYYERTMRDSGDRDAQYEIMAEYAVRLLKRADEMKGVRHDGKHYADIRSRYTAEFKREYEDILESHKREMQKFQDAEKAEADRRRAALYAAFKSKKASSVPAASAGEGAVSGAVGES